MAAVNRRGGKYSPTDGFVLPAEGFTGVPDVPCPAVCDEARSWWASWATSQYGWFFGPTEWQDLADVALIMHGFYISNGNPRYFSEASRHMNNLFGLGTRAQLHVSQEEPTADMSAIVRTARADPRLKRGA